MVTKTRPKRPVRTTLKDNSIIRIIQPCYMETPQLQYRAVHNLMSYHLRPKPSHSRRALFRSLASLSPSLYSGSISKLKHVCEVGKRSVSGPARWICFFYGKTANMFT